MQIQTSGDEFFLPDNEVFRTFRPIKSHFFFRLFVSVFRTHFGTIFNKQRAVRFFGKTLKTKNDKKHNFSLRFDRIQSFTKCRTFVCRTRNQFVFHNAKFFYEHLRCEFVFFVEQIERFSSEKTVAIVEMDEKFEQYARFYSCND